VKANDEFVQLVKSLHLREKKTDGTPDSFCQKQSIKYLHMLKNKTHETTAVRIERGEYNFSIRTVPSDPLLQRHFIASQEC